MSVCLPPHIMNCRHVFRVGLYTSTALCYALERGFATASRPSVYPSVRDVEVSLSHSLEYFENRLCISSLQTTT